MAAAAKEEAVAKVEVEVTTEVAARDKAMPEDGLRRQGTRQAEADRTSDAPHICAAAIENVTAVDKIRRQALYDDACISSCSSDRTPRCSRARLALRLFNSRPSLRG